MKIVIVGAGYAGAATAWWLARAGAGSEVTVLDSERRHGEHASGRNAGLVMSLVEDEATCEMTARGSALLKEHFGMARRGSALLSDREDDLAALIERARQHRLPVDWQRTEDLARGIPPLRGASAPLALRCKADGTIDPRDILDRYLDGARDGGVRIITGAEVTSVTERSGRVTGVETTAGRFEADRVVNAAGAWAGRIAAMAGLGEGVSSYRRHLFVSAAHPWAGDDWPFVWDLTRGLYFRSDGGRLTLCACDDDPHDAGSPRVDPEAESGLRSKVTGSLPALASLTIEATRACLRTFAADRRYVIGPDQRLAGFFWIAGLGGTGATAGAAIGEMAAGLLRGGSHPLQDRFSPARLAGPGGAA